MKNDLPQTISYTLPGRGELPRPAVPWTADPARSALLVHDMQRHFLRPYGTGLEPARSVVANTARLIGQARQQGIPVFYTAQPAHQQPRDRALLNDFWGAGIGANEEAAQIIDELSPEDGDTVLTKWRYSAFQRSNLTETLRELGRDQLVITGVYAHIGCQVSAADAFMNDVQPFMVADAVADFSAGHHRQALEWVAGRCGVVTDTDSLSTAWATGQSIRRGIDEVVRGHVAELVYLEPAEIGDHDNLLELGLDSIRLMDLVETLRGEGLQAAFEVLAAAPTIHDWARALEPGAPQELSTAGAPA
ncbi:MULTISPECIES: isochorismatase family protein [Arthrobacter]|uniref:isochorismatase family protein n=1 Tax=unclassified Arthrobacter TaxID=235627 RepID=UPI0024B927D4|nr:MULTISPECIES: isochorismatase family protein [unclassified Arthrobacter]MDJ0318323.1 isochorismatase family protein [Arthrobacter sp. H35-MC1]MDO5752864.1 isochorismatase family protein [Arthrobacter sp.]